MINEVTCSIGDFEILKIADCNFKKFVFVIELNKGDDAQFWSFLLAAGSARLDPPTRDGRILLEIALR
jgi:hypothetical protein